ncbi:MAG: hypothetical protein B6240_10930 [Desulfobacteraceae bacterium 4572_87]|nr:MAG: hypothetical protein B6240_10930 [Desulfobacteraceae bacterium 4572_87]
MFRNPMFIHDIQQVKTLFKSLPGTFLGVGMTAFSRILPASFLENYHILALHKTGDLPLLRKKVPVFCLEEETDMPASAPGQNSAGLLAHPQTRRFLDTISGPKYFFLYQDYPELRSAATTHGWNLLANPPQLRLAIGKRRFFKKMVADLNLHPAPGDIHPIEVIHKKGYEDWRYLLGPDFVVQLPEIERGGGRGTFFIHTMEDYQQLQNRLAENRWRNTPLESVSIHQFLHGTPASMVICVTRHGTLVSSLQRQLLDIPCCGNFAEDGVFCGHAWGASPGSRAAYNSAFEQACRMGVGLGTLGYKGILGIDFIVHETQGKAWPIEINPLVFQPPVPENGNQEPLRPGLYEYGPKKVGRGERFFALIKETLEYGDIQNENQFILSDGPRSTPGGDSHSRLCRLLFSYPVMDTQGALSPQARLAAEWVREHALKGDTT